MYDSIQWMKDMLKENNPIFHPHFL